jgi:hypothetical protein
MQWYEVLLAKEFNVTNELDEREMTPSKTHGNVITDAKASPT